MGIGDRVRVIKSGQEGEVTNTIGESVYIVQDGEDDERGFVEEELKSLD